MVTAVGARLLPARVPDSGDLFAARIVENGDGDGDMPAIYLGLDWTEGMGESK